jgi:hypothetical protein
VVGYSGSALTRVTILRTRLSRVPSRKKPGPGCAGHNAGPVLTEPWFTPELAQAAALEWEAAIEIGPGHPLSGHALTVIAACPACDSAAFRADGGRFAIVHLTWTRHQEPPPWPTAEIVTGYRALEAAADKHAHNHQD